MLHLENSALWVGMLDKIPRWHPMSPLLNYLLPARVWVELQLACRQDIITKVAEQVLAWLGSIVWQRWWICDTVQDSVCTDQSENFSRWAWKGGCHVWGKATGPRGTAPSSAENQQDNGELVPTTKRDWFLPTKSLHELARQVQVHKGKQPGDTWVAATGILSRGPRPARFQPWMHGNCEKTNSYFTLTLQ